MPIQVISGAALACSFGAAPSELTVLPVSQVSCSKMPAATISDFVPVENIAPFGMCSSPTNPEVIAATTAALGVPTPAPCVPATTTPWTPGAPTVSYGKINALNDASTCLCSWAGVITITDPGQAQTTV
jgi:hypothetical protein